MLFRKEKKKVVSVEGCAAPMIFRLFLMFLMSCPGLHLAPGTHVRSNTCEPLEVTLSLMIIHDGQSLCK